jgi:hypothetical protein
VENGVTQLATTNIYAKTHTHVFHVTDEAGRPVPQAQAVFYAVTYGGLFAMLDLKTDDDGNLSVPLGYADIPYTFSADSLFAFGRLDGFNDTDDNVTLHPLGTLDETFELHFLTSEETVLPESEEYILPDFDLRKRAPNASATSAWPIRATRATFYASSPSRRTRVRATTPTQPPRRWLKQCERLAGAADDWLHALDAARADSARLGSDAPDAGRLGHQGAGGAARQRAIADRAQILAEGRARWALPDSLWRTHVLALPSAVALSRRRLGAPILPALLPLLAPTRPPRRPTCRRGRGRPCRRTPPWSIRISAGR